MYDQPPPMKMRRPGIPGGTPGPTPNNIGQPAPPVRQPPQMIGGGPGPTGIGGYPATDGPPGGGTFQAGTVGVHTNPMPPRIGGGGPAYGGPPLQGGAPPRITRPPQGMPGGGPGPTPFGTGAGGFGIAPGGPGEGGPGPGLPGGPGGNPYMQPPMPPPPMAFPPANSSKPHYDTGMPDEWRRQRQRQALGQEQ